MALYAKVTGTTVDKFPYSLRELKADNPNVSFTTATTLDDVAQYGVVSVTELPPPNYDPATQKLQQDSTPVLNAGTWELGWSVVSKTQEEQDAYAEQQALDADLAALKSDPQVVALLKARPTQINNYIDNNVTDLTSAKEVLKVLARAVAVVGYRVFK